MRLRYTDGNTLLQLGASNFSGFPVRDEQYVTYRYGRSVSVYPFNFIKYESDYKYYIDRAVESLKLQAQKEYIENMRNNQKYVMDVYIGGFVKNEHYTENYSYNQELLKYRERLMGIMVDWKDIGQASSDMIYNLNSMISQVEGTTAAYDLAQAKECMKACMMEYRETKEDDQYTNMIYFYNQPYLTSIACGRDSMSFSYSGSQDKTPLLAHITSWYDRRKCGEVVLSYGNRGELLKAVELRGSGGGIREKWRFNYYHEDKDWKGRDYWGYYTDKNSDYGSDVKAACVNCYSLSQVINSRKGMISLAYEPNEGPSDLLVTCWGGIRLKQLITNSGENHCDTVDYIYPIPGVSVYDKAERYYRVNYGSFGDVLEYPRYRLEGNAFFRTGNGGLYYPYVQEVMRGKGTNAYLYSVASVSENSRNGSYSWWLSGQLLGTASYGRDNRLVRVTRNRYAATLDYVGEFSGRSFFEASDPAFAFRDSIWQVKSYPYFSRVDYSSNMNDVEIFNDNGYVYRINPAGSLKERRRVDVPSGYCQYYRFYYGGNVLLKSTAEYRFFTRSGGVPVCTDIEFPEAVAGCRQTGRTEYRYDNPQRVGATGTETENSDGSRTVRLSYTSLDLAAGTDPMVDALRQRNVVGPVLKQQLFHVLPGGSRYDLLSESVSLYRSCAGLPAVWLPSAEWRLQYREGHHLSVLPAYPASSLFTYSGANYRRERLLGYALSPGVADVTVETGITGKRSFVYDGPGGRCLLSARCDTSLYLAAGRNRLTQDVLDVLNVYYFSETLFPTIRPQEQDVSLQQYLNSDVCKKAAQFFSFACMYILDGEEFFLDMLMNVRQEISADDLAEFVVIVERCFPGGTSPGFSDNLYNSLFSYIQLYYREDFQRQYELCRGRIENAYLTDLVDSPNGIHRLTAIPGAERHYRLWFYPELLPGTHSLSFRLEYSWGGGETLTFSGVKNGCLLYHDIVLPASVEGSFTVTVPRSAYSAFSVLVPAGIPFRAECFTESGLSRCFFDESGRGEGYGYDNAGRLIGVSNMEGNLVKSMNYNVINP